MSMCEPNSKGHINQPDIEVGKSPSIFCTIPPVSLLYKAWIQRKYIDDPKWLSFLIGII